MSKNLLAERLRLGEIIMYREHGNSMLPIIKSGQLLEACPATPRDVGVGKVVFCKVKGRYITHKVTAIRGKQYQISNNKGRVNGWITANAIYGIITRADGKDIYK